MWKPIARPWKRRRENWTIYSRKPGGLRNRMEQIDSAITALKPLLASTMEGQPVLNLCLQGMRKI